MFETTTTSTSLPSLPIEIWEKIIDSTLIDPNSGAINQKERLTIYACGLTCRAWLPRARFYLYDSITIHSDEGLSRVLEILSYTPAICDHVRSLTIIGGGSDTPWFIRTFIQLGSKLKKLFYLTLRNFSLIQQNPHFFKTLSIFRAQHLTSITLQEVQYSRYSQITRCFSAATSVAFHVVNPVFSGDPLKPEPSPVDLGPLYIRGSPRWVHVTLPWSETSRFYRDWTFTEPGPTNEISIQADWPDAAEFVRTKKRTVRGILGIIERFCMHTEKSVCICFDFPYVNQVLLHRTRAGEFLFFLAAHGVI